MTTSFVQWILAGLISALHPFYIAMVEINHNAKESTVDSSTEDKLIGYLYRNKIISA